jgi:predicted aldo/keto reductase-like oxidoreductase
MRFAKDKSGQIDRELARRLVIRAAEAGVNYFDTSYYYQGSEEALGAILAEDGLRDRIFLATKLPHQACLYHYHFDRYFNIQLSRLQTDHVDYYLIHNLSDLDSWERLVDIGIEDWIADKKASGAIRQIGFSFHGNAVDFKQLIEAYDWDFCQIQYNYMDEFFQAGREGIQLAYSKGMSVMVMEPLLGGRLATDLPKKAIKAFAAANPERSAASWALRWLFDQREVTLVLSGMNAPEQLEDNLACADVCHIGCLSDAERKVYGPVQASIRSHYKVSCNGCNYCMPCPNGVNIPGCFSAYNRSYSLGYLTGVWAYLQFTGLDRSMRGGASACRRCGQCEAKCSQNIPIVDTLAKVRRRMEPFWIKHVDKMILKRL